MKKFLKFFSLFFAGALCSFLVSYFVVDTDHDKDIEKEGVFWVVKFNSKGKIQNQILADYIRENREKGEVVCKDFYSNDLHIFAGKVSVRDLTLTKDYINFTTDFGSIK